jgi:hypothetical protein
MARPPPLSTKTSNDNTPPKKTNSVKNKLTRIQSPKTSTMNSTKKKQSFPLYVVAARDGVVMAFITKPNQIDHQGFAGSIFRQFRENHTLAAKYGVDAIFTRRKPAALGYNEPMLASPRLDEEYNFNMFVQVHEDPNNSNPINNEQWGRNLAKACNEIASTEFKFPTTFVFKADLTNVEEPLLPPVNTYILNADIMCLIDKVYPPTVYSREQQADNLIEDYFGDDPKARDFILTFDYSI